MLDPFRTPSNFQQDIWRQDYKFEARGHMIESIFKLDKILLKKQRTEYSILNFKTDNNMSGMAFHLQILLQSLGLFTRYSTCFERYLQNL